MSQNITPGSALGPQELAHGLVQWLFVDLNSYFASVEQQLDKRLRHRPVAVVPSITDNTSVIAASIEAKKFGIKTNTKVYEAKRLCPEIIFVSGNHEKYVEIHHKIVEAVERCVPISAVLSIDEMACKLMGSEGKILNALKIAQKVKEEIKKNAGDYLQCSVGLAPNRFLAKVASDRQKPDGLVTYLAKDLPQVLYPLALRDFPGIGRQMEKRLNLYGVGTSEQLCSLSLEEMRKVWGGVNGEYFWKWLRGEDTEERETQRRTVGHSHVLPPEYRNRESAYLVLQKLLHKAAARLRKEFFWCTCLSVGVSYLNEEEPFYDDIRFLECRDDITLLEALETLWNRSPRFKKPLKVSVTLSGLVSEENHTLSLFRNARRENLVDAIDKINARYGKNTVQFASLLSMKGAAPTRIAFTNIPDFTV